MVKGPEVTVEAGGGGELGMVYEVEACVRRRKSISLRATSSRRVALLTA
jgi:hypothetical protein